MIAHCCRYCCYYHHYYYFHHCSCLRIVLSSTMLDLMYCQSIDLMDRNMDQSTT